MGTVNWRCTLDVILLFALIFSAQWGLEIAVAGSHLIVVEGLGVLLLHAV